MSALSQVKGLCLSMSALSQVKGLGLSMSALSQVKGLGLSMSTLSQVKGLSLSIAHSCCTLSQHDSTRPHSETGVWEFRTKPSDGL